MEQLRNLLAVRELRVNRIRAELAQSMAVLADVDAELASINEELAQIARQRFAWERDWQQWLQQDRVIRHGQDYSLAHTALSAWGRDAKQAHEEVSARHERVVTEVRAIRQRLYKAEQLLQALQEQSRTIEHRRQMRRIALVESRSQDEPRLVSVR
jgi:chromosome segregation ATPase